MVFMIGKKFSRWARKRTLFFGMLLGVLAGMGAAHLVEQPPSVSSLAGGYMHAFPGDFSAHDLSKALLYQFAPLFVMYLGAYGKLSEPICLVVLFMRGFASGAGCLLFYRGCEKTGVFSLLFFLLCVMELLMLAFYHSCGKLSLFFSKAIEKGMKKNAVKVYTLDILFFVGMILAFYLLRGCVVNLLNS